MKPVDLIPVGSPTKLRKIFHYNIPSTVILSLLFILHEIFSTVFPYHSAPVVNLRFIQSEIHGDIGTLGVHTIGCQTERAGIAQLAEKIRNRNHGKSSKLGGIIKIGHVIECSEKENKNRPFDVPALWILDGMGIQQAACGDATTHLINLWSLQARTDCHFQGALSQYHV